MNRKTIVARFNKELCIVTLAGQDEHNSTPGFGDLGRTAESVDLRDDIESHVRKWGPEGEGLKDLRAKIEAELKAWGPQIHSLQVAADS